MPKTFIRFVGKCLQQLKQAPLLALIVVLVSTALPVCAQGTADDLPQSVDLEAVREFFKVSGWHKAMGVKSVVAVGTVDNGDGKLHPVTIKVDRDGLFHCEIPDLDLVMTATAQGGAIRSKGKRQLLSTQESAQLSATALVPIFLPIAEIGRANVLAGLGRKEQLSTKVSIAKSWNKGDGLDHLRTKSGLFEATFDDATHLLASVEFKVAVPFETASAPARRFEYSNYELVDGFLLPFSVRELFYGQTVSKITFAEIRINPALTQADFAMPEAN